MQRESYCLLRWQWIDGHQLCGSFENKNFVTILNGFTIASLAICSMCGAHVSLIMRSTEMLTSHEQNFRLVIKVRSFNEAYDWNRGKRKQNLWLDWRRCHNACFHNAVKITPTRLFIKSARVPLSELINTCSYMLVYPNVIFPWKITNLSQCTYHNVLYVSL